jgi:hypothetical protein
MANTFTKTRDDVFGGCRVVIGTYTATDGGGQGVIQTGLNNIYWAGNMQADGDGGALTHTAGGIDVNTASSGDTYTIMCVGN